MLNSRAAFAAAARWLTAVAAGTVLMTSVAGAAWNAPWKDEERALVIDAYEFNPIDWNTLVKDERIAGFVNKASDGLPPAWSCRGLSDDEEKLCKNRWWKYSVTQELYQTRRQMAKALGLKWGAYHLGRPGNPREQADHFIDFTKPEADELVAIDIEDNDPKEWMSLADAEIFAEQVKIRIGRYPVLYTNGSTAAYIAKNSESYPLLSRLPLWYARYRDDITGMFPEETWPTYALWQFSSMHNCGPRSCPYRVEGAKSDIDVNVSPLTVAQLKTAWPFADLVGDAPPPPPRGTGDALVAEAVSAAADEDSNSLLLAAYGPTGQQMRTPDPLALLTQAARAEHRAAEQSPILSKLTDGGAKVDPVVPGVGKPLLRETTMPTHAVDVGRLNASGLLQGDVQRVKSILHPAQAPIDLRPATPGDATVNASTPERHGALAPETTARSTIAAKMRAAEAQGQLLRKSGHVDREPIGQSALAQPQRGARVSISPTDRRIADAFGATE